IPSVNSSSRPNVCPSSTLTTPSLPTFSIASAITSPISRSRDEMLATRAMSSRPETSFDCDFRLTTTASTAFSMPRLSAIGFAPAFAFALALARQWCDFREHIGLAQDQHIFDAELDLGAAVLGEDDLVPLGDVHFDALPVLVSCTRADGQHTSTLRLLPG